MPKGKPAHYGRKGHNGAYKGKKKPVKKKPKRKGY